jgi:hypothetical protein
MTPRFRACEVVRVVHAPVELAAAGGEAVVEEVTGPNEAGTGWLLTLRLCSEAEGDTMIVLGEDDLEATGFAEDDGGQRVPLSTLPAPAAPADRLELRLFTEITDSPEAARVAQSIEQEVSALIGGAAVTTEAERHWSEPYNYELLVSVVPEGDPVEALQILAEAGGDGWLAWRDDGWRCDLWWSSGRDPDAMLIVPEVHAAEIAFLPWSSPTRRDEADQPLVSVTVPDELPEEPTETDAEAEAETEPEPEAEPGEGPSDAEAGDEEA